MKHEALFSDRNTGIILAADVDSFDKLRQLVHQMSGIPEIAGIKVGFSLALRFGLPNVVKMVREISNLPLIYDHQKAGTDIPEMGPAFAVVCREAGIHGVIFFPQAGPKTLQGFVLGAIAEKVVPIVGLVMTHPAYLASEGGYIVDTAPAVMADTALELGVTHFVLPGTKPKIVQAFARGALAKIEATIMMPGVGSQGGVIRDVCKAAAPHRSFPIIGSAIYAAKDPKAAACSFAEQLNG